MMNRQNIQSQIRAKMTPEMMSGIRTQMQNRMQGNPRLAMPMRPPVIANKARGTMSSGVYTPMGGI